MLLNSKNEKIEKKFINYKIVKTNIKYKVK